MGRDTRVVAMFRTYLKPQANLDELGALHQKMHAIVTNQVLDAPLALAIKEWWGNLSLTRLPSPGTLPGLANGGV
jgi:hypothetical protein